MFLCSSGILTFKGAASPAVISGNHASPGQFWIAQEVASLHGKHRALARIALAVPIVSQIELVKVHCRGHLGYKQVIAWVLRELRAVPLGS